jgi:thymidylate synthase
MIQTSTFVDMNNLDKQYQALLQDILDNGVRKEDRTGTGTLSIFGKQVRHKMSEGFPLLTTKKMPFRLIATELMWFLRGDTNIKYLVDNDCHIWDGDAYKAYLKKYEKDKLHGVIYENDETQNRPFSKEEFINWIKNNDKFSELYGELGPVYGKQWRSWETYFDKTKGWLPHNYDQIANLIQDLKTNPDSRRLMVSAWNVGELDSMTLPPCHYGFQVYTRELSLEERVSIWDKKFLDSVKPAESMDNLDLDHDNIPTRAISLMWNQRSVDTFLGLPFNIASYGLLLEIIATTVNMVPDELIGNLGDTHLYLNHVDQAKEQLTRQPYPLPTLNINTEWWPTESGECGIGPIDAAAVFHPDNVHFYKSLLEEDLQLANYQAHPAIKAPLSN